MSFSDVFSYSFVPNPDDEPEGRWVALLRGSAGWDPFILLDPQGKAMRRRLLIQAGSNYYNCILTGDYQCAPNGKCTALSGRPRPS